MSGSMSLSCLDSGFPVTIRRFSRTENWTKIRGKLQARCKTLHWNPNGAAVRLLTEWLAEMNDSVVVFEHVNFIDVGEGLDA
jgi:hypothetical protein